MNPQQQESSSPRVDEVTQQQPESSHDEPVSNPWIQPIYEPEVASPQQIELGNDQPAADSSFQPQPAESSSSQQQPAESSSSQQQQPAESSSSQQQQPAESSIFQPDASDSSRDDSERESSRDDDKRESSDRDSEDDK